MTGPLPSGWRGRAVALGLALVALSAIYALIAVPLLNLYADNAAAVEASRAAVNRLALIAQELPTLRAQVAELRDPANGSNLTTGGESDAVAAAALQSRLEEFAATAGLTIGSTESIPSEPRGAYRRFGLRLVLTGSFEGLLRLLASIEKVKAPPVMVDTLHIRALHTRPGEDTLSATFDIYALRADVDKNGTAGR